MAGNQGNFDELILFKLKNRGYWGRRLMNLSDLVSGVPKEARDSMETAANNLFKKGLLERKPGNRKEFRYSLNPSKKDEISARVKIYIEKKGVDFRVLIAVVVAIMVIECVALMNGIDGTLLMTSFVLLGAIAGKAIPLNIRR